MLSPKLKKRTFLLQSISRHSLKKTWLFFFMIFSRLSIQSATLSKQPGGLSPLFFSEKNMYLSFVFNEAFSVDVFFLGRNSRICWSGNWSLILMLHLMSIGRHLSGNQLQCITRPVFIPIPERVFVLKGKTSGDAEEKKGKKMHKVKKTFSHESIHKLHRENGRNITRI